MPAEKKHGDRKDEPVDYIAVRCTDADGNVTPDAPLSRLVHTPPCRNCVHEAALAVSKSRSVSTLEEQITAILHCPKPMTFKCSGTLKHTIEVHCGECLLSQPSFHSPVTS